MPDDLYAARRHRLISEIAEGVLLVRGAAPAGVNRNFFYLTGIEEPRGALLLAPQGVRIGTGRRHPGPDYVRGQVAREVLFLPERDELAARWGEDSAATVQSVLPEEAGVDAVLSVGELGELLSAALRTGATFHYVRSAPAKLSEPADLDAAYVESVRRCFFGARIEDATPRVEEMRRLKDTSEIRAIERAIEITGEGIRAAMRVTASGMHERELEAELTRSYRSRGGKHAFDPIVASGPNALLLHYKQNAGLIGEGQLVLLDTGAAVDGYGADVSRTFPVSGKFDDRQREIYEAVLHAQQAAIAHCRPGALLADIHADAYRAIEAEGFAEHFVHGTSHHLGLETHDVGDVHRPLEPGALITVEPGIYIEAEGIGVRIEDDVLITEEGSRNLSEGIPRAVDEIEGLLAGG